VGDLEHSGFDSLRPSLDLDEVASLRDLLHLAYALRSSVLDQLPDPILNAVHGLLLGRSDDAATEGGTNSGSRTVNAERGSPKYERAAMRWFGRYLTEGEPRLRHFAEITTSLAERVD
jgi:hypothetical protein